jgi:RNA polymerase-associated protein RTF1
MKRKAKRKWFCIHRSVSRPAALCFWRVCPNALHHKNRHWQPLAKAFPPYRSAFQTVSIISTGSQVRPQSPLTMPRHRSSGPGTPNSLESAPMEESDSDNDEPQPKRPDMDAMVSAAAAASAKDEGEKYPVEGLYINLAEKEEIMRMREVDREIILAERRDEAQRFKENRLLRQLVSAQEEREKEQQRHKKRSADEADIGHEAEGRSKPSRQRAKVGEGIDTLRRQRAEKHDRARRREEDREKEKTTPRKGAGRMEDGYGEEEEEWRREKSPEKEKRGRPDPELADFQRVRIGRTNFPEICFKPAFEKVIVDCYVRVLGKPSPGQQPKYHMLPVKGTCPRSSDRAGRTC